MTHAELEHVPCPACGADEPRAVLEATTFRFGPERRFRVVRCGACELLYTNPRPRAADLASYYPDDYYDHLGRGQSVQPPKGGFPPAPREKRVQRALRDHLGYPGPGRSGRAGRWRTWPLAWRLRHDSRRRTALEWSGEGELLDFGCGDCGFLRLQRSRGWTVSGIDFSETVASRARERDGLEVVVGTWPGEAMSDRRFDVITSWHNIEHLPDPTGWARQAARQLRPGGYLLVCCPDADSWAFGIFGRHWSQLDLPRHLCHFTKQRLARLLEEAGLVVDRVVPQVRTAPLRASARLCAEQSGSRRWKLLAKLRLPWSLLAKLAGWFGKSDAVVVIARKS